MAISQKKIVPCLLLSMIIAAVAAPPAWWSNGNPPVIDPIAPQNNLGPANIGQAKHMAKSAIDALRPLVPDVTAVIENDLASVVDLSIPSTKTPEWLETQKAPLLVGQLKAIAAPFYTRLNTAAPAWLEAERISSGTHHSASIFPWTTTTADDNNWGLANIGQLKAVFSLRFTIDSNGDGAPNLWEISYGLDPTDSSTTDPDGDGLTNAQEFALGSNPMEVDTDGDGVVDFHDAVPTEKVVNWQRATESGYILIEVDRPSTDTYPLDLNNQGQVLFRYGLWTDGTYEALPSPTFSGPAANPDEMYHATHETWEYLNDSGTILGIGSTGFPESYQHDPDQETLFLHNTAPGNPFDLTASLPMWGFGNLTLDPVGIDAAGNLIAGFSDAVYSYIPQEIETRSNRIVKFAPNGSTFSYLPLPESYENNSFQGLVSTRVTPSGWCAALGAATSQSAGPAYRALAWSPSGQLISLPQQASGQHPRIHLSELPGNGVCLITNSAPDLNSNVFLLDPATGSSMKHAPSLSGKYIQAFAGDGTAMTSNGQLWRNGKFIPMRDLNSKWKELEDNGYLLLPLKANAKGTYLIQAFSNNDAGNRTFLQVPIVVKDNVIATGVDDVSRTADKSDRGYQSEYWIMAPLQGPPLPGGSAYENSTQIRTSGPSSGQVVLDCVNATPNPAQFPSDENFHAILWRGNGDGVNSEQPLKMQIAGGRLQEAGVKVKAMKHRIIKVVVYLVAELKADGTAVQPDPLMVPS